MMTDQYFYEIPVYQYAPGVHADKRERFLKSKYKSRYKNWAKLPGPDNSRSDPPSFENWHEQEWYAREFGPWQYNKISAWIRLYRSGTTIRAELWRQTKEQSSKKLWYGSPKFIEISPTPHQSSMEIYQELSSALQNSKMSLAPQEYIDLSTFATVGPLINWRQLMGYK